MVFSGRAIVFVSGWSRAVMRLLCISVRVARPLGTAKRGMPFR